MRAPDALLFDLWGTLIESERFDPERGHAAALALCDNPRSVTLPEIMELGRRVVSAMDEREDRSSIEFTQGELLRIVADSFGLRYRHPLEEVEWEFWKAALELRLIEGVEDLLTVLRGMDLPLGVVSNSSFLASTLERELKRLGVLRHFEFVVSSADYGVRKPDPIIFETALRRLGRGPETVWFAGDNVTYDIVGGTGAGMFCVAFNPRTAIPEGTGEHRVISRWSELPALIAEARAS
jgi:putative hydrolase of the HAD superfamily